MRRLFLTLATLLVFALPRGLAAAEKARSAEKPTSWEELKHLVESRLSLHGHKAALEASLATRPAETKALLLGACCSPNPSLLDGYGEKEYLARLLFEHGALTPQEEIPVISALTQFGLEKGTNLGITRVLTERLKSDPLMLASLKSKLSAGSLAGNLSVISLLKSRLGKQVKQQALTSESTVEVDTAFSFVKLFGLRDEQIDMRLAKAAKSHPNREMRYLGASRLILSEGHPSEPVLAELAGAPENTWGDLLMHRDGGYPEQLKFWTESGFASSDLDKVIAVLVRETLGPRDWSLPEHTLDGLAYLKRRGPQAFATMRELLEDPRVIDWLVEKWPQFLIDRGVQVVDGLRSPDRFLSLLEHGDQKTIAINMRLLRDRVTSGPGTVEASRDLVKQIAAQIAVRAASQHEVLPYSAFGTLVEIASRHGFTDDPAVERSLARYISNARPESRREPISRFAYLKAVRHISERRALDPTTLRALDKIVADTHPEWRLRSSSVYLDDWVGVVENSFRHPPPYERAIPMFLGALADELTHMRMFNSVVKAVEGTGFKAPDRIPVESDMSARVYRLIASIELSPETRKAAAATLESPALLKSIVHERPAILKTLGSVPLTEATVMILRDALAPVSGPVLHDPAREQAQSELKRTFRDLATRSWERGTKPAGAETAYHELLELTGGKPPASAPAAEVEKLPTRASVGPPEVVGPPRPERATARGLVTTVIGKVCDRLGAGLARARSRGMLR